MFIETFLVVQLFFCWRGGLARAFKCCEVLTGHLTTLHFRAAGHRPRNEYSFIFFCRVMREMPREIAVRETLRLC